MTQSVKGPSHKPGGPTTKAEHGNTHMEPPYGEDRDWGAPGLPNQPASPVIGKHQALFKTNKQTNKQTNNSGGITEMVQQLKFAALAGDLSLVPGSQLSVAPAAGDLSSLASNTHECACTVSRISKGL
jgi:hypothetical protein